jgi:hypothetical protein
MGFMQQLSHLAHFLKVKWEALERLKFYFFILGKRCLIGNYEMDYSIIVERNLPDIMVYILGLLSR